MILIRNIFIFFLILTIIFLSAIYFATKNDKVIPQRTIVKEIDVKNIINTCKNINEDESSIFF